MDMQAEQAYFVIKSAVFGHAVGGGLALRLDAILEAWVSQLALCQKLNAMCMDAAVQWAEK